MKRWIGFWRSEFILGEGFDEGVEGGLEAFGLGAQVHANAAGVAEGGSVGEVVPQNGARGLLMK